MLYSNSKENKKGLKVLSVFDGVSCARVALERAGIPVEEYYASEIDKYAIQISQKNYPDIRHIGDVKDVLDYFLLRTKTKDDIELLIGGSPCQDLSIAGKRKGLSGERSGLFYEYVRILKEVKPKYFILENVASMSKEAKETITKELFGIEPVMINASLVSAQNRKRLFWVGKLVGDTYQKVEISQPEDRGILLKDILEENVDEKYYLNEKNIKHLQREFGSKGKILDNSEQKSPTLTASMGTGGGNVTTIRVGQLNSGGQGDRIYSTEGKSTSLNALGGGGGAKTGLYHIPHGYIKEKIQETEKYPTLASQDPSTKHLIIANNYNKKVFIDKSGTIGTSMSRTSKQGIGIYKDEISKNGFIRKLTPVECERLQGLPDNYTEGVSNTQRYKTLGNAFNVDVVAHIIKELK